MERGGSGYYSRSLMIFVDLMRNDRSKAVEILVKDLKVFSSFNEELFKEITQLLALDNFRQNEQLSKYGDTKSAHSIILVELKKLIEANPLFRTIMTISKDRVKPSPLPDSWKLKEIFATGIVLGGYLALLTVIFFWLMKDTDRFPNTFGVRSIRYNPEEMMAALYLQVSIVSQALIFVTRSRS
ncbi:hypothetical protein AgCh_026157 [Apium graveolens]